MWVTHLAGHVRRGVPAAVGEVDGDEGRGDPCRRLVGAPERVQVRAPAVAEEDAEDDDHREHDELRHREDVLRPLAALETEDVEAREEDDSREADDVLPRRRHAEENPHVATEARREGRDGPWKADPEARPAREKTEAAAERLREVDVLASATREEHAELSVAEGSRERERPAQEPDAEERCRGGDGLCDEAADEEDARADDAPDDQHGGIEDAEDAQRLVAFRRLVHARILT